jgi:hypothetical protein
MLLFRDDAALAEASRLLSDVMAAVMAEGADPADALMVGSWELSAMVGAGKVGESLALGLLLGTADALELFRDRREEVLRGQLQTDLEIRETKARERERGQDGAA